MHVQLFFCLFDSLLLGHSCCHRRVVPYVFYINLGGGDVNILFLYIPTPPWLFEQAEQHDLSRCPRIKNTSVVVLPGLVQSPRSDVDIVARLQNIHLKKWIETKKHHKKTSKSPFKPCHWLIIQSWVALQETCVTEGIEGCVTYLP